MRQYDIIVCGGGPAGVAAAVSAARNGAQTLLVEKQGYLGGIWTAGLLSLMQDVTGKNGILREIRERLAAENGYLHQNTGVKPQYDGSQDYTYDAEYMKYILERMCQECGVQVLLYSWITGVTLSDGLIQSVEVQECGGTKRYSAKLYADCTGNGDLAALCGHPYEQGSESGQLQPASLIGFISGFPEGMDSTYTNDAKKAFYHLFEENSCFPSYRGSSFFRLPNPDIACIMINHEYQVQFDSSLAMTQASIHARKEVFEAVKALRHNKGWENVRLVATAPALGIREGRRYKGVYCLTTQDLISGARFADGICLVGYPVDIHGVTSAEAASHTAHIYSKPYHIPYRSLISGTIANLGFAGRCVSGNFYAHASFRVTGNAVPMGEALGIAAGMAVQAETYFTDIDGRQVQKRLLEQGHML